MTTTVDTKKGYCGLCGVHCPTIATVDGQRVLSLRPDTTHPAGGAICAKGRAAPELHDSPQRLNYPLRRTRPKTDADPGWEPCSWDEALDLIATRLGAIRSESGPQAVAFSMGTRGGTGISDSQPWIQRLAATFGTPNVAGTTHLCQWPRDTGTAFYTYGVDALPMPDVEHSACILLWGVNPSANYLNLVQRIVDAKARGARLIVIDPRRAGVANKADLVLQVRPGTDGALALSIIHVLIQERLFDEDFVRRWTNAPLLVRDDTDQLLRFSDDRFVAAGPDRLIAFDPKRGAYAADDVDLFAERDVPVDANGIAQGDVQVDANGIAQSDVQVQLGATGMLNPSGLSSIARDVQAQRDATGMLNPSGLSSIARESCERANRVVTCSTVFSRLAALAAQYPPAVAEQITRVPAAQIVAAARLLAANRPVSHFFHNGLVQHTNATQSSRAIGILYALLGDWDRRGGNVLPPPPRLNQVAGKAALPKEMDAIRLGRAERPIGPPARSGSVAAYDLYEAILEGQPYPVRGVVAFGANMLLANGDTLRGREALEKLEFFAQVELVETPTSRYADVLLPATSFLESSALKTSDGGPVERAGHVRRRDAVVRPLYERRPDVDVVFDLATRLGLGEQFWDGDLAAAYDHVLAPSGLTWDSLQAYPDGVDVAAAPVSFEKYARVSPETGVATGFDTPTRKVELFSVAFAENGQAALPAYLEPAHSPLSTPELARQFPLVLTNAKSATYLHSQHRGLPSLRRTVPNPRVEIHPATAAEHRVRDKQWVRIETLAGSVRAQALVTSSILPGVVCATHGWWQGCEELGLAPLDPYSTDGANVNLLVLNDLRDPISGGTPHRSTLCRLRPLDA